MNNMSSKPIILFVLSTSTVQKKVDQKRLEAGNKCGYES